MEELIKGIVEKLVSMTERAAAAETDLTSVLAEVERLEEVKKSKENVITALKEEADTLRKQVKEEQENKLYWYRKFTELQEQVIKEKEEEKENE